jgi:BirA family transcriptional regulator, biotin operon repressor / biotin---[acetyl-CoA-carboxylase] ligase
MIGRNMTVDSRFDVSRLLAAGFVARVEHYALLDSTQQRAREAATNPFQPFPLLVVADRQTAGRGRGDNSWWTGEGNLAMSLLFDPAQLDCPHGLPCMSLAASVAVIDAIDSRTNLLSRSTTGESRPLDRLGLRWPNDVYFAERKLGGVLVEALPEGLHILGIGLNTNSSAADAPTDLQPRLATLRDLTGGPHDHTELMLALLERIGGCLRTLGSASESLGRRFDELCLQHGQTLTLYQGERTTTGRCLGIAPDGGLILETPTGSRTFHSGTLQPPRMQ